MDMCVEVITDPQLLWLAGLLLLLLSLMPLTRLNSVRMFAGSMAIVALIGPMVMVVVPTGVLGPPPADTCQEGK